MVATGESKCSALTPGVDLQGDHGIPDQETECCLFPGYSEKVGLWLGDGIKDGFSQVTQGGGKIALTSSMLGGKTEILPQRKEEIRCTGTERQSQPPCQERLGLVDLFPK